MMKNLKTSLLFCLVLASPSLLSAEKITILRPSVSPMGSTPKSVSCQTTVFLTDESLKAALSELKSNGTEQLVAVGSIYYSNCDKDYSNKEKVSRENELLNACKLNIIKQLSDNVVTNYMNLLNTQYSDNAKYEEKSENALASNNLLNVKQEYIKMVNRPNNGCEPEMKCSVDLSDISENNQLFSAPGKDKPGVNTNYPAHYSRKHIIFHVKKKWDDPKNIQQNCTKFVKGVEFVK